MKTIDNTHTHTYNVINISEYHQSQGGGSVHADFSVLGQKWAESGILLSIQYTGIWYLITKLVLVKTDRILDSAVHSDVIVLPEL